jgi:hypothetical protein
MTGPSSSAQITIVCSGGVVERAMIAALLGRSRGRRCGSRSAPSASAPLGHQDPADLAAADGDALGPGGGQGVQGPRSRLLLVNGGQGALGLAAQPPRRVATGQRDDLAAL